MAIIQSIECASCGANRPISADLNQFVCDYCGKTNILVERDSGEVTSTLQEEISHIKGDIDRAAAELAIPRLEKKISSLEAERSRLNNAIVQRRENLYHPIRGDSGERFLREKIIRAVVTSAIFLAISFFIISRMSGDSSFASGLVRFFVVLFIVITLVYILIGNGKMAEDRRIYQKEMQAYQDALSEVNRLEKSDLKRIEQLEVEISLSNQKLAYNKYIVDDL